MKLKRCYRCGGRYSGPTCERSHALLLPAPSANETWRPVLGYEGSYQVSDCGRVRGPRGRILKPTLVGGYPRVSLCREYERDCIRVHRLVLLAFVGEPPEGHQAAHLDGNPQNPSLANLAWVSAKENVRHKFVHGTMPLGGQVCTAKLTADRVREMRQLHMDGHSARSLAKRYGVAGSTVDEIVNRRYWRHVS